MSEEVKYTRGPWEYDAPDGNAPGDTGLDAVEIIAVGARPHYRQCIATLEGMITHGEDIANARLISAAPELLESLEWFVNHCKPITGDERAAYKRALAAIAKAKAA